MQNLQTPSTQSHLLVEFILSFFRAVEGIVPAPCSFKATLPHCVRCSPCLLAARLFFVSLPGFTSPDRVSALPLSASVLFYVCFITSCSALSTGSSHVMSGLFSFALLCFCSLHEVALILMHVYYFFCILINQ